MWTRIQLKEKAKAALNNNYWKIVLVSLIVGLVGGGITTQFSNTFETNEESSLESEDMDIFYDLFSEEDTWNEDGDYSKDGELDDIAENDFGSTFEDGFSSGQFEGISSGQIAGILIIFFVILFIAIIIASVVGLVYNALIYNPIEVGTNRFMVKTLNEPAEVKEVAFAFDNNYKNIAKILFIRDLKVLLWSLLFIIPGIVKSYEYLLVPYLLAENPNLTKEEAFRLSKQMMTGQKWDAFILGLSFFWWDLLSGMTAGIVGIFYVNPYKNLTYAALYEKLSAINGYPARAAAARPNMGSPYAQTAYTYTETTSTTDNTYNSLEI